MTHTPPEGRAFDSRHKWVRPLVDYGGLAVFGVTYVLTRDIVAATWAIVAGSALAIVAGLVFERRVALMPLLIGAFGLIFGGLTVMLGDKRYIKMEGSFLYVALGAGLLVGVWRRKNPLRALLGSALHMPDPVWRTLAIRYGLFFLVLAVVNEIVRQTQTDDVWASFKLGKMALSLIFSFAQLPLMMKGMKQIEAQEALAAGSPDVPDRPA
jgi:intracellular septation protein